jgi:hypothetical protein
MSALLTFRRSVEIYPEDCFFSGFVIGELSSVARLRADVMTRLCV